jgi:hypothetical protein
MPNRRLIDHYASDEVRSALQKSIRRGLLTESVYWGYILFQKEGMLNAWEFIIKVCLSDIGPAETAAIMAVLQLRQIENLDAFASACALLATLPKSLVNLFGAALYPEFEKSPRACAQVARPEVASIMLRQVLKHGDIGLAIYYTEILLYTEQKTADGRPGYDLVWNVFYKAIASSDYRDRDYVLKYLAVLKDACGTTANVKLAQYALLQMIHLWCSKPGNIPVEDVFYDVQSEVKQFLDEIQKTSESIFEIPDYALDMTTERGTRMGRRTIHYLTEALVLDLEDPEWKELTYKYLRNIYPRVFDEEGRIVAKVTPPKTPTGAKVRVARSPAATALQSASVQFSGLRI